ncbi:MAG: hypothetical protein QG629_437 [Patescibacteria group bacterium]|nr:hypothetical protein [Candidatus Saccharibacteria bacterium]MDQ5963355.1 hypothetical protein [Patescibacteria group bacterium]
MSKVKIVTFVPLAAADTVRRAMGKAGAGKIGEYSFCSYAVVGKGRFTPSVNANPHVGTAGSPEIVEEERIEVVCDRSTAKQVIAAIRGTHPYEEVALDIYPLLEEQDL